MRMNAYFIIKALYLMALPVTFVFHYNSCPAFLLLGFTGGEKPP